MSAAAVEHAATFSWAHTVDALLASYGHAITDYRARHQRARGAGAAQRPPVLDSRRSGALSACTRESALAAVIEDTLKESDLDYASTRARTAGCPA